MEEAEEIREPSLVLLTEKRNFSALLESYSGVQIRMLNSLQFGREESPPCCPRKPSLFATRNNQKRILLLFLLVLRRGRTLLVKKLRLTLKSTNSGEKFQLTHIVTDTTAPKNS
jgi:hypothetical protein